MNAPPAIAMVWDDMTRLGGVNTWLYQCVDGLPRRGLDTWLLDFGAAESGQVDVSRWRRRILTLRPGPWESAAGFRRRQYRQRVVFLLRATVEIMLRVEEHIQSPLR